MDTLAPPVQVAIAKIWDYMQVGHSVPASASVIMALGSNDPRVADRAAELYLEGRAPVLLFSGGVGALTAGLYGGLSEAAYFKGLAVARGVPAEAILVEGESTNTGENIRFSRELMQARGMRVDSVILVQKPFMERRTLATFLAQWTPHPVPSFFVTSPQIPLRGYPREGEHRLGWRDVVEVMCGDLQRIAVYPKRGFQVFQEIPVSVWEALQLLTLEGYGKHMIRSSSERSEGASGLEAYEGVADALPPSGP